MDDDEKFENWWNAHLEDMNVSHYPSAKTAWYEQQAKVKELEAGLKLSADDLASVPLDERIKLIKMEAENKNLSEELSRAHYTIARDIHWDEQDKGE